MTYDQILTLDAIIKNGSFKAASAFLNKSQPAISVAIKKLEEEFQIQIFNREQYRPTLTYEGKLFYEKAKAALSQMRSLELFGEELGLQQELEIKVGMDGLTPLCSILNPLKNFFENYQSTKLNLEMDNVSGTFDKVLAGELNLGFAPLISVTNEIESHKILQVKMIPLIHKSFLTKSGIDIERLKQIPQIVLSDSSKNRDSNFGLLEGGRRWNVSEMNSKKEIITSGLGWGRLPDFLIENEMSTGELEKVPLAGIDTHYVDLYMIRNKTLSQGPIAKKLWEIFKDINDV